MAIRKSEIRRNEVIQFLLDTTDDELKKIGIAEANAEDVAHRVADRLADAFSGQVISFPVEFRRRIEARDNEIFAKHTGDNTHELAREYGLSVRALNKALARTRQRHKQSRASAEMAHDPHAAQGRQDSKAQPGNGPVFAARSPLDLVWGNRTA